MQTYRDRYAAFFARGRRKGNPADEAAAMAVADVCDSAIPGTPLTTAQLRTIIYGISHPRAMTWMSATELVNLALSDRAEIADAIAEMLKNPKAHVRFNAICCLTSRTPADVIDTVLRRGLSDKSERVRWKAAQTALTMERKNLIPEMTAALAPTKGKKARAEIGFSLSLLRDGFILEPANGGGCNITVPTRTGISGRWISDDTIRTQGIDAIIKELQS